MSDIAFFDASTSYGEIRANALSPCLSSDELITHMDNANISRAMVFHHHQNQFVSLGNELLTDGIKGKDRLYGVWALQSDLTGEMPSADELPKLMKENRIFGLRIPSAAQNSMFPYSYMSYLQMASERGIPIFMNEAYDISYTTIYDLLFPVNQFPDLVIIYSHSSCWASDRLLRPLFRHKNFYLSLTNQMAEGGIESLTDYCGAERILFGSDFPSCYMGAQKYNIQNADISECQKALIASGNLDRILSEACYE
jgi:predicted TIM-barrel fold metal-dependent hydrolase